MLRPLRLLFLPHTRTLDANDIRIVGPGGDVFRTAPSGLGVVTNTTAGTARTVTYRMTPPGGSWDSGDNGDYRIVVQAGQVRDILGAAVPAGDIGMFRVEVSDPALINVGAMLAAGEASVAHTPFDIGIPENLFDGRPSTLVRTPNIDPAVITLSFLNPQTVTGMRQYFSYADGDPGIHYTLEAATSLADLDGRTGSYRELVFLQGTAADRFSNVMFGTAITSTIFRLTAHRLTGDDYVHVNEWQLLGVGAGERNAPTSQLETMEAPRRGDSAQFLRVTYSDATGVRVASIDNGDLLLTGPNGVMISPVFYDVDQYWDGTSRTATYWFRPPGGQWDYRANGTYTVQLQAGAVRDSLFNTAATAVTLGTFTVDVPPPQFQFPEDLAELNAAGWITWADGATASASDDTSRTLAGQSSIRFDTTGGFDTSLRYPVPGAADWDLTHAAQLHFKVYAENSHGFQEGPWVRLYGVNGGFFEYRYQQDNHPAAPINDAVGQWTYFVIPLNPAASPSGWQRSVSGTPTLQHIGEIEFHADTWDSGFTLWYDDIGVSASLWRNPEQAMDVDDDGDVVSKDALIAINELNFRQFSDASGRFLGTPVAPYVYFDVNGDGFATALDALLIINALNGLPAGDGEAPASPSAAPELALAEERSMNGERLASAEATAAWIPGLSDYRNLRIPAIGIRCLSAGIARNMLARRVGEPWLELSSSDEVGRSQRVVECRERLSGFVRYDCRVP